MQIVVPTSRQNKVLMTCLWSRGVGVTFLLSDLEEGNGGKFFIKLKEIE
jgi:hypothetical protein